jgi:hypothetical protein
MIAMRISELLSRWRAWLGDLGYAGERRALALLPLCLFGLLYFVLGVNAEPGWGPALFGLSLAYLVAFFALAAGWFWARWFASGLGWSGFMVGLMAITMLGWHPTLAVYGGLHALVVIMLMGGKMAARYEMRQGWRERFAMDEYGVARLGKAVTRGAGALPTLILWALAPREPQQSLDWLVTTTSPQGLWLYAGLGLLLLALVGLVFQRGVAVLALGAAAGIAGAAVLASGPFEIHSGMAGLFAPWAGPWTLAPTPLITLLFLTAAFLPWAGPLAGYLTRRR